MPVIAGELRTSTESADDCAELPAFTCGDGRIGAEQTVDEIVQGYTVAEAAALPTLRVTREHPSGSLVGLVAIKDGGVGYEHPLFQMPDWTDPVYIAVLTLSSAYRGGYRLEDGTPVSYVLLRDAMSFAASQNAGEAPTLQAIIAPENESSRTLFQAHGFEMIPTSPELLYIRPKGLAIPGDEPHGEEETTT
jgi:hypothetical protein